ncbi:MAG: SDR family oxidoreductase [Deltaproteobacteria bacterium]|nr:MAG: SDR family oxidoreductase [Deltaproteobacteria bacterium]
MKNTYVLIGGSSGIGLEVAKKLDAEDNQVFVLCRHRRALPESDRIVHIPFDVLQEPFPEVALPVEAINGLAYFPGSINLKPFRSLKQSDFMSDLAINYLGAVRVLQSFEQALKKGTGSVVLFSTVAVQTGMPFHASVAGAKGAIEGLVRALAAEWAPTVRVNAVAPSLTRTPLAARLLDSPRKEEAAATRHPLKRVGNPREIADAVCYLLSPEASWITGQIWHLDGGMSNIRI